MESTRSGWASALILLVSASAAAQQTVVVDPAGNPGADYESLQLAVDAVPDGTRILVRDGVHGSLSVVGRSLTIEADANGFAFLEHIEVRDVGAGQSVTVRGFEVRSLSGAANPIKIEDCVGSVWLEDLFVSGNTSDATVRIASSDAVTLTNDVFFGIFSGFASAVIHSVDSTTTLFDSIVLTTHEQDALWVEGGFLGFYEGEILECGLCSLGVPLRLLGADPHVELQGVEMNGFPAPVIEAGTLEVLASPPKTHRVSSPVYDDDTVAIRLEGEPGDVVRALFSFDPAPATFFGPVEAPLLLGPRILKVGLGALPPEGELDLQFPIGDLGPGIGALGLYSQAIFLQPGPSFVFSEPTAITLLEQGLRRADYPYASAPSWSASPADNVVFGASIASAGDVNGDGFDDVIVGDPGLELTPITINSNQFRGGASVYHGSASGLEASEAWRETGQVFDYGTQPEGYGLRVGSVGDLNGDGFDDVFVMNSSRGLLYVYYGSSSGLSDSGTWVTESPHGLDINAFGGGDVNGDGFDDLLFLRPRVTSGGIVYDATLWYGSTSGLPAEPDWETQAPGTTRRQVAPAGDTNGDGYADFLVGARSNQGSHEALVELYHGGPGSPTLAWTYGDERTHRDIRGAGDVNGDGLDDIVIGFSGGLIDVFYGTATIPDSTPDVTVDTPFYTQGRLRPVGDADGDGYDDLFVEADSGFAFTHNFWFLLRGSPEGPRESPSWRYERIGIEVQDYSRIAPAGDVNGDGLPDLLISDYDGHVNNGVEGGTVRAFHGLP